jgi:hypothetical protein
MSDQIELQNWKTFGLPQKSTERRSWPGIFLGSFFLALCFTLALFIFLGKSDLVPGEEYALPILALFAGALGLYFVKSKECPREVIIMPEKKVEAVFSISDIGDRYFFIIRKPIDNPEED